VLFFIAERFAAEPILPLDLFRNQVFAAAAVLSLLQIMILIGLVLYLPLWLQGVRGVSATDAGALVTPQSVMTVVGAVLAGFVVARLKRYQEVTIVGTLVMTAGVFLVTWITQTTTLVEVVLFTVVAGLGLGTLFGVLTLAAQNALPRTRLGVGTGAVRYLSQVGAVLGVAIVGTVVNSTLSHDIVTRLPATAVAQLPADLLKSATNPQVLVDPVQRETVLRMAEGLGVQGALNQVLDALRLSLAVAIQHGFVAVLVCCALAVLAACFLKDVPLEQQFGQEPGEAGAAAVTVPDMPVIG
jgi:MFS family permease